MIWEWRRAHIRSGFDGPRLQGLKPPFQAEVDGGPEAPPFRVRCSWTSFQDPREKFE